MTATHVNVGTAAHADNATVVPALPVGIVAGDTLLLLAANRSVTATVTTPAGWTPLGSLANVSLFGKIWNGTDPAPNVTFAGSVAGDTCSAQIDAWRGLSLNVGLSASLTNISAQNIAYPALTPPRNQAVVFVLGWKQDDWTSVTQLVGMTEIAEAFTVVGNDQGLVWDYVVQTTATAVGASSFVVTGGLAAVSKGLVVALEATPVITTTLQPEWPPRVLVTVTGLTLGDVVSVYRVVSGARTAVRAGSIAAADDVSFVVLDAELPFGVPVSYLVSVNGMEASTASTTYTLTGGKVALTDAVGGQSAEVVIRAWPEKAYDRRTSRFRAGGRNIVVAGELAGYSGTIELFTETTSSRDNVAALLDGATEGTIQIRQPGGYDGVDSYVVVTGWIERRFSQDGTDQRRTLLLDVVEVEGWAPALEARGYTLQDVANAYTGLTLANLGADYATLLALAQASF